MAAPAGNDPTKAQAASDAKADTGNRRQEKSHRINVTLRGRDAETWARWRARGRRDTEIMHRLIDYVEGSQSGQARLAGLD